jgi:pimeloyl-ACP methyl ester carboxylesterase
MDPALPALDGVEHRFLDLPGLRMHVAEAGDGDPLVLLHGFPQHWWEWRKLIPALAARHRVICPDLRGFGWSDAPPGDYAKEQLANDIVALLDALELERVGLVGHDWGGFIGFLLCLRQPERFERYLALNTGHPFTPVDRESVATLWRFWYQYAIAAPVLGPRLLAGGEQQFPRMLYRWSTVRQDAWSAEDTELFLAQLREPARTRASVALYRTFVLREITAIMRGRYKTMRLQTPTLFLHGSEDPVLRPTFLRGYEAYADDMKLELVDGVGHFIADEAPELVGERALDFFARAESAR